MTIPNPFDSSFDFLMSAAYTLRVDGLRFIESGDLERAKVCLTHSRGTVEVAMTLAFRDGVSGSQRSVWCNELFANFEAFALLHQRQAEADEIPF